MRAVFLFLFIAIGSAVFAGEGEYAVSKISPALLKNANAVLRFEDVRFEVVSVKEAIETNHYVITILNENGDIWAEFQDYYDKLRDIVSVEGVLYDASGRILKKMKTKELQDLSGVSDISLMEDNRIKKHNFYYKVYPYTIEYIEEIHYKHTMFFPIWVPQGYEKLSVELSRFSIVCDTGYQFRYKNFKYSGEPDFSLEKNKKITSWIARNLIAVKREVFGPELHEMTTVVVTGPTIFQFGNYKGDMSSWNELGKFQYLLNNGRDILPDNVKKDVQKLTEGIGDVRKKIQILYEYLQKNTRYVSIQLGVGGWQPFDAAYVAKKGYGDCKALSNYMHSLLKEVGIRSNYSLIRAGNNARYITDDFPSRQFNHVILSVPLEKDTMWLECTSQYLPAGYLSGFTDDRYALVVNEDGGKLVRTPKYGLRENLQFRKINATLDEEATLVVKSESIYSGLQQDLLHQVVNYLSKDKVKEFLHEELDFPTYDVSEFEYNEEKSMYPTINEKLTLVVSKYANITGKRLFIQPNIMTRFSKKLSMDEERNYDLILRNEYREIDSIEITIPRDYEQESIPSDIKIETKFGKYINSLKVEDSKIIYYRIFEQYSGRFPASDYRELAKFYESVYKADRNKVVLVKNDTEKKAF